MRLERAKCKSSQQIDLYSSIQDDIQLCEDLFRNGETRGFDRSLIDDLNSLLEIWTDRKSDELFDSNFVWQVEDRLANLPFEKAIEHKQPVDEVFAQKCLEAEWRTRPELVMDMPVEKQIEAHRMFEYMCYFVINAREELLYDIESRLFPNE